MSEAIPAELLLEGHAPPLRAIAEELRGIVRRALPTAVERVRVGWHLIGYDLPVGRRTVFACWVWPESEHVHLGFQNGVLMGDPDGLLQGKGITKRARWLTFRPGDPIEGDRLVPLILECARIATLSSVERRFIALEQVGRET